MGEDQRVYKHMCKLCNKSFPCGRSLGGHMRSHVINSADHHLVNKKKLSSLINNNGGKMTTASTTNSNSTDAKYGLRENPKKTCKFKDSSHDEDTFLVHDKLCKECGKGFQSWKALFGHMKCHSDKITTNVQEQQESWTTSQSDNENLVKNNRKKRSSRRNKRYNLVVATACTTTTSSSFSMNAQNSNHNNNNGTSQSVSEIHEQEQEEEIALCLMMLSRDVGPWGGGGVNFNYSVGESSDNIDSAFVQANLVKLTKIEGKSSSGGEIVKIKKLRRKDFKSSEIPSGSKMIKLETQLGDFLGKSESGLDLVKEQAELGARKFGSIKRKSTTNLDLLNQENCHELFYHKEYTDQKKSKFECTTCNKSFHSYQALGGHRASHNKFKGCCFDSRAETSIETEPIHHNNEILVQTSPSKKMQVMSKGTHACPICFRIFSSGQALGGHKRSHLIAEAKMNQNSSGNIVIQKPIRHFLDLNMPAPVDQEEISSSSTGYKPWWAEINHKHESLVGLISN